MPRKKRFPAVVIQIEVVLGLLVARKSYHKVHKLESVPYNHDVPYISPSDYLGSVPAQSEVLVQVGEAFQHYDDHRY